MLSLRTNAMSAACQSCRLSECDAWKEPCLCACHDSEYTPGYDEQVEADDGE